MSKNCIYLGWKKKPSTFLKSRDWVTDFLFIPRGPPHTGCHVGAEWSSNRWKGTSLIAYIGNCYFIHNYQTFWMPMMQNDMYDDLEIWRDISQEPQIGNGNRTWIKMYISTFRGKNDCQVNQGSTILLFLKLIPLSRPKSVSFDITLIRPCFRKGHMTHFRPSETQGEFAWDFWERNLTLLELSRETFPLPVCVMYP